LGYTTVRCGPHIWAPTLMSDAVERRITAEVAGNSPLPNLGFATSAVVRPARLDLGSRPRLCENAMRTRHSGSRPVRWAQAALSRMLQGVRDPRKHKSTEFPHSLGHKPTVIDDRFPPFQPGIDGRCRVQGTRLARKLGIRHVARLGLINLT